MVPAETENLCSRATMAVTPPLGTNNRVVAPPGYLPGGFRAFGPPEVGLVTVCGGIVATVFLIGAPISGTRPDLFSLGMHPHPPAPFSLQFPLFDRHPPAALPIFPPSSCSSGSPSGPVLQQCLTVVKCCRTYIEVPNANTFFSLFTKKNNK
jgi:hypothetical protein